MKTLNRALAYSMAWLMAAQPLLTQAAVAQAPADAAPTVVATPNTNVRDMQPRELTGFLDDKTAERRAARAAQRKAGVAEDGTLMKAGPLANLPVVDDALNAKSRSVAPDDTLRIILHLDFLPHAQVLSDSLANHRDEVDALEQDRKALLAVEAAAIDPNAKTDAENFNAMTRVGLTQRAAYDSLAQRNEALGAQIKSEVTTALRGLIESSQAPVVEAVEQLGGTVEFTTIAGNMVIAKVPAESIEQIGKIPGLLRVVEDSLMESHLNVSDTSTMVDPADVSLTGLWDAGRTGGIYDPAIIDSGVDQQHPAMANNTTPLRDNFCSWYLVAGNDSANFGDQFTCDDLQGHGTHVAGIVGSYGSTGWSQHLGIAHGVEKMVNLKAGWLNSSTGRASMFWSDKYNLVDRALNNNGALVPGNFTDDVDGFNLSYGGDTTLDDTDGSRFWDSVVSTYADTPVTISAGNSGPSNTLFSDPAVAYNVITVANFNDRGTTTRNDDIINSGSTVGPTASGRRKPDLAAPGTSIAAPNDNWETAGDFVNLTGTSMAAPMVLGVIMDLMDAGVFDELELKALLINTAQKNLPGMDIEGDFDGWDPQIGWGAMNAHAAYFHRSDVETVNLAPRDTEGEYKLFKGTMRDEGATGEGRDRATMVWNRHATYDVAASPDEFFTLTDMNLRLYRENDQALLDSELGSTDNVHQVRVPSGSGDTDVVIKPYAWSTTYSHGDATERVALAMEDGFVEVELPATFQGIALWPTEVEPNEVFDVTFWIRNDSEIASHNNEFNLELQAGWTLISGTDTQNVGSAQAGGITNQVTYTLRAPNSAVGASNIQIKHSHTSYLEEYGDFNWNIGLTVAVDNTPPNPNPMNFSVLPNNTSTSTMAMTAAFATDIHGPIDYYLDYTSSPSGGLGGTDSGWQATRNYTDNGLGVNDEYCYRAWARDNANFRNTTTPSSISCSYTSQTAPTGVAFGAVTTTSIAAAPTGALNNLTLGLSGVRVVNNTASTASSWQQNTASWSSLALTPARSYDFLAQARNGNGDIAPTSATFTRATLANPPAVDGLFPDGDSAIKVSLNSNGNSNQAQYLIQNTTAGVSSGWISDTSYQFEGLDCETSYNFQARARNPDGIETIIVPLGQQSTGACTVDTDNDGVTDSADNCTLVPNADQRDTNGDGFGNACDADLNNDGIVNAVDLGLFRTQFFVAGDIDADFNGDMIVNAIDLGILRVGFFAPPGPSGVAP